MSSSKAEDVQRVALRPRVLRALKPRVRVLAGSRQFKVPDSGGDILSESMFERLEAIWSRRKPAISQNTESCLRIPAELQNNETRP
jgi:hypothetical protein